jgi:hypothetical protein
MRVQDLEGRVLPLAAVLADVVELPIEKQDDLHLMYVLCGHMSAGLLLSVGDRFVFVIGLAPGWLETVLIDLQLQDQLSELVLELAEVANEQLVLVVVDLMSVGDRLLLDGVIVWDDVPELNEVQQRKGELGQLKSDPTCR